MMRSPLLVCSCLLPSMGLAQEPRQENEKTWVWWEGETPAKSNFAKRSWFAPQNDTERQLLSAGAWLSNDGTRQDQELYAEYQVTVPQTGAYAFWARKFWKHGPFRWRFDRGAWQVCGRDCALADSTPLRTHVVANWVHLGEVELKRGPHLFELRLLVGKGEKATACFDAFLLTPGPFQPRGKLKPGEKAGSSKPGWWAFEPELDRFEDCLFDLRSLNEEVAGESGFIRRRGEDLVLGSGRPVRFWSVNCGPEVVRMDHDSQVYLVRLLAKRGVNMVRIHGPIFDPGARDPATIDLAYLDKLHRFIHALKQQGIYSTLSFYFPLWFKAKPSYGLKGYKEGQIPFALLTFDARMQEIYKAWARGLLQQENPYSGLPLGEDPAVAILELVNEDSYFFWTFKPEDIPSESRVQLERDFALWLGKGKKVPLRSAWHMTRAGRGSAAGIAAQVRFLAEHQRRFYQEMIRYMRQDLKAGCLFTCSNWKTADPVLLDGLERWTYTAGDVLDQHGYFSGPHKGPRAHYSLSVGDSFADRAGVLEPEALPLRFFLVKDYPHMISEIGWPNPNRYKAELPFLAAAYASLQGLDALQFFALGTASWDVAPRKFPVNLPTVMGQFPATALMYRRHDLQVADPVVEEEIRLADLFALKGSLAAGEQNLDQLREVEGRTAAKGSLDPLAFYVGRVMRSFEAKQGKTKQRNLDPYIDRKQKLIRSLTGELVWDYGKGIVILNSPRTQGAVGFLNRLERIPLADLVLECQNEFASVLLTSLDGRPLSQSKKILIQAVTEEMHSGFEARAGKIQALGAWPILLRQVEVTLNFKQSQAGWKVLTLDANGKPRGQARSLAKTGRISLAADTLYHVALRE